MQLLFLINDVYFVYSAIKKMDSSIATRIHINQPQ